MNAQQDVTQATEQSTTLHVVTDKQTTFTKTRRFVLTWDNSRIPPRNRIANHHYDEQQRADGVHFGNGLVALDNGSGFETLGEMEIVLKLNGHYSITWID